MVFFEQLAGFFRLGQFFCRKLEIKCYIYEGVLAAWKHKLKCYREKKEKIEIFLRALSQQGFS